ncbi:MAG: YqgE/AlgH family protein [Limnobacter sp.]|nr:YqgE/AlgH family protein [Limnobacter sp.]
MSDDNPPDPEFSLTGQLLVAMPGMTDPRFERSVVYVCEHSSQGAMGLIVNKSTEISLSDLFAKVELEVRTIFPEDSWVLDGGPVSTERGFVLHSVDRVWNSSLTIDDEVAMTTSRDILEAVASGHAPKHWLITLGYSGWSKGQLEQELAANAWLNLPADRGLLFDEPLESRFNAAFRLMGIDPLMVSGTSGNA